MKCALVRKVDPAVAQPVEVFLLLHLLGHDTELHRAGQLDHGRDHFLIDLVRRRLRV